MLKLLSAIESFRAPVAIVLVLALAQSLANLYLPRLMSDIVDHGIVPGDRRRILAIGGLMLLVAIAGTVCAVAGSYFSSRAGATPIGSVRTTTTVRIQLMVSIMKMPSAPRW